MLRSLVRRHAFPPPTQLRRVFFSTGTPASSSGDATASPDPHFMVEYLVSRCGFSADEASKVSKSLPRIRSAEKPEAVVRFFRSQGLDGANLRKIISLNPRFLAWDVETKLVPKFQTLRDMGLSESGIIDVVLLHPILISLNLQNTILPRLKDWESLFGSREILFKNLRRHGRFLGSNIENVVRPNLNFLLNECGMPEDRVSCILRRHPCFFVQKPDSLRALVDRAEGIGIHRGSAMFLWILDVLQVVSREKFDAQSKIMNSFGLSNSDFVAAIKQHPTFLCLSTDLLQRKMEFLVKDVGITPSEIVSKSVLLALSLEKRLIPRFHVMEMLRSEGLWTAQDQLRSFFKSSSSEFLHKFVIPHKDKLPKLLEVC